MIYMYRTERWIEIVADSENEAEQLLQAELHDNESVLSVWRREET